MGQPKGTRLKELKGQPKGTMSTKLKGQDHKS